MSSIKKINLQGNTRLKDESFDKYRERIHWENKISKLYLKQGHTFWDSVKKGTYKKEKENG